MKRFQDYGGDWNFGWSIFLFCFHMLGELIPLTILFVYQFQSNKLWLKSREQLAKCKEENPDNPYACTGGGSKKDGSALAVTQNEDIFEEEDDEDSYYNEDDIKVGYSNGGGSSLQQVSQVRLVRTSGKKE
jgi:hypothetical protein